MGVGGGHQTVCSPRKAWLGKARGGGVCLCVCERACGSLRRAGGCCRFRNGVGTFLRTSSPEAGGQSATPSPRPRCSLDPHARPFGFDHSHLCRFPVRGLCAERWRPAPCRLRAWGGSRRRPRVTARASGDPAEPGLLVSAQVSPGAGLPLPARPLLPARPSPAPPPPSDS